MTKVLSPDKKGDRAFVALFPGREEVCAVRSHLSLVQQIVGILVIILLLVFVISILPTAQKQIAELTALGFDKLPVCFAKTQYSFSDDPSKLGAPEGFTVTIKNVKVSAGANFLVALTGDIMTMPGLPKSPAAERIDVDENGVISGLF